MPNQSARGPHHSREPRREHEPWHSDDRFDRRFDDDDRYGDRRGSSGDWFAPHYPRHRSPDDDAYAPAPTGRGPHRGKGPAGFRRSDERIHELACEALTDHDEVDATHVEVTVRGGEITLSGEVPDRRTKRLAEECVEEIRGVTDVHNQLHIQSKE